MCSSKVLCLVVSVALAFVFCGNAAAGMMTFQGPTQANDNCLIRNYNEANFGGGPLDVGLQNGSTGIRRSLLRFDLSALAGKTVTAASLTLTLGRNADAGMDGATVELDRILPANAGWVMGTGTIFPGGETGASCWNYKAYNTVAWAGLGGLDVAGTDYDATPVGSFTLAGIDTVGKTYTVNFANVSFLQGWINNPANNAGFRITSPTLEGLTYECARFYSSEDATASNQPLLTVTYAPEPSTFALLLIGLLGLLAYAWRKRK